MTRRAREAGHNTGLQIDWHVAGFIELVDRVDG